MKPILHFIPPRIIGTTYNYSCFFNLNYVTKLYFGYQKNNFYD